MHPGRAWVILLVASVALAGCGGSPESSQSEPTEDLSETHGTIVGLVTDDESLPLEGTVISLQAIRVSPIAIKIFSGMDGRFRIENVQSGKQTVSAEKEGYTEAATTVTVVPGIENPVRFVMSRLPSNVKSHYTLTAIPGSYTCGLEAVVSTGPCDYEIKNHTGQDPIEDKHNHTLEIPANWGGILLETRWTTGVPATSPGIRFQVESQEDLGGFFVRADGVSSPLRVEMNAGQVAPDATLGYPIPQRGMKVWVQVMPLGYFDGGTCPAYCGYGVGAVVQLNYQIYVTYFFGQPVDKEFSALT